MKKSLLFIATCCIAMGAMAQIQVKSDGNVYTNAKSVFINKQDSISGMGYGYTAYLPTDTIRTDFTILSPRYVDFMRSDNNRVAARFYLQYERKFDFYGKVTILKDSWTGGITSSAVTVGTTTGVPGIYPVRDWYGALGTASNRYASAFLDHIYVNTYTT